MEYSNDFIRVSKKPFIDFDKKGCFDTNYPLPLFRAYFHSNQYSFSAFWFFLSISGKLAAVPLEPYYSCRRQMVLCMCINPVHSRKVYL